MRVLYLCHRIPYPPNKGEKIRAYQQLRAIAERHEIHLFTLAHDSFDFGESSGLQELCRRITVLPIQPRWARLRSLPFLLGRTPLTLPYFHSQELVTAVRQALRQHSYDRIFVYCSAMAQYVENVGGIPIITDLVDVDSDKWTQYAAFTRFPYSAVYRREGRWLREYERKICARSQTVLVSTEREAELARKIAEQDNICVLPNGVDSQYFCPGDITEKSSSPTIVFTGDMSYFPNQDAVIQFARFVLPLVRRSVEGTRFVIVGRSPSREVRRLESLEGVEVTGFVPDVRIYLRQAWVAVAPFSIAAGIQNKILEAMCCGLPVVATPRAAQGLQGDVSRIVQLASGPEEMAAVLIRLLNDRDWANEVGEDGRSAVTATYNWSRIAGELLYLLERPDGSRSPEAAVSGRDSADRTVS